MGAESNFSCRSDWTNRTSSISQTKARDRLRHEGAQIVQGTNPVVRGQINKFVGELERRVDELFSHGNISDTYEELTTSNWTETYNNSGSTQALAVCAGLHVRVRSGLLWTTMWQKLRETCARVGAEGCWKLIQHNQKQFEGSQGANL